jgi:hypothetical protein
MLAPANLSFSTALRPDADLQSASLSTKWSNEYTSGIHEIRRRKFAVCARGTKTVEHSSIGVRPENWAQQLFGGCNVSEVSSKFWMSRRQNGKNIKKIGSHDLNRHAAAASAVKNEDRVHNNSGVSFTHATRTRRR